MKNNFFSYQAYRTLLQERVEDLRRSREISISKVADQVRISRTYLSQVLNSKKHLHEDQLYKVCQALFLTNDEIDYVHLLREIEISKIPKRRHALKEQCKKIVNQNRLYQDLPISLTDRYFSDPDIPVVHALLQISRFSENQESARNVLGIPQGRWGYIIETLKSVKAIQITKNGIKCLSSPYIPPPQSAAEQCLHLSGRTRVVSEKLQQTNIDDFMYNWWFVCDKVNIAKTKVEVLKLIQAIHEESKAVKKTGVYQLNIDLFCPL